MTPKSEIEAAPSELEYLCPVHVIKLTHLLAGGAGHCRICGVFVQSLNHPQPTLDPVFAEKREAAMAAERKTKANAKAKARRASKKTQTANDSPAGRATR